MTTVEEFAPAKVNLALHVTGRRADGYHLLDSFVVFAGVGDTIYASPADKLSLTIDGPEAHGLAIDDDNLVLRAARFLDPDRGAALRLTKNLPVASGIGGGSADAAATLRALSRLWDMPLPKTADTAVLGADVPVCLDRQSTRMCGVGEMLLPAPKLPQLDMILVNPRVQVSTPRVFSGLARRDTPPLSEIPAEWRDGQVFGAWLAKQRNDLLAPAVKIEPVIAKILDLLAETKPLAHGMSGSGASCFALYPSGGAGAAFESLQSERPAWWWALAPVL